MHRILGKIYFVRILPPLPTCNASSEGCFEDELRSLLNRGEDFIGQAGARFADFMQTIRRRE